MFFLNRLVLACTLTSLILGGLHLENIILTHLPVIHPGLNKSHKYALVVTSSVLVVGFMNVGVVALAAVVLAQLRLAVSLGVGEELRLRRGDVFRLASPRLEHGALEGSTVGECQRPRLEGVELVHGAQLKRGLLF